MKEFNVSPEALKKFSKMNAAEMKVFMQNIYEKGFTDGSADISGIPIGSLLKQISEIPGVGSGLMKKITKVINDLLEEEKIWNQCVENEQSMSTQKSQDPYMTID